MRTSCLLGLIRLLALAAAACSDERGSSDIASLETNTADASQDAETTPDPIAETEGAMARVHSVPPGTGGRDRRPYGRCRWQRSTPTDQAHNRIRRDRSRGRHGRPRSHHGPLRGASRRDHHGRRRPGHDRDRRRSPGGASTAADSRCPASTWPCPLPPAALTTRRSDGARRCYRAPPRRAAPRRLRRRKPAC